MIETGKVEAPAEKDSDVQRLKRKLYENRWWGVYLVATYLICALPNWTLGRNFGYAAWTCSLAVAVAVHSFWTARTRLWFRLAVTFILFVHIAVLCSIRWTNQLYLGATYRSLGELDFVVTFAVLWLMQKVATSASAPSSLAYEGSLHSGFDQDPNQMDEDKG